MKLCVIDGDGIGREVVPATVELLKILLPQLEIVPAVAGWDCFLEQGVSVPPATLEAIQACGAALFGAVQSPTHRVAGYRSAILTLRQALDLYANIRPSRSWPAISPRPDVDMLIFRENSEGLYVGKEREMADGEGAIAERWITRQASARIAQKTVALAHQLGRKKITIVHKANVLPLTDGVFRDTVRQTIAAYSAETGYVPLVDELLVDVAALKIVSEPEKLDVLVTTNLFGDILSDASSHWMGGLGYAPSLNWGAACALAEPVHGSAPDIAGQGIANPIATVLSAALLVRYYWQLPAVADRLEGAVATVLSERPQLIGRYAGATVAITHALREVLALGGS